MSRRGDVSGFVVRSTSTRCRVATSLQLEPKLRLSMFLEHFQRKEDDHKQTISPNDSPVSSGLLADP